MLWSKPPRLHGIFFVLQNLKFGEPTLKSELVGTLITLKFRKEAGNVSASFKICITTNGTLTKSKSIDFIHWKLNSLANKITFYIALLSIKLFCVTLGLYFVFF